MTVAQRSPVVVLLMMLFTAACGADGDVETAPSVTSSPATAQTLSQPESSAEDSTSAIESGIDETTTTTRDPGAGGTVDLGYLVLGPGTRFVPLDDPVMIPASEVTWLAPDSIVLGVVHPSGEVQAFAADMMAYHHIANTTVAGEPYLVTY